jgi:predicted Zn-dependent peptidase
MKATNTVMTPEIVRAGRAAGVLADTKSWRAGAAVANVARGFQTGSEVQRTVLPNGLTVLSEYVPGVRSIAFGAWVRAATLHERRDQMGISHLLEHMVFKGTERRSAKEISLALETLGGSLDAYTSREHTSYQAHVLDENVREAADVIADVMFRPLLRDSDLRLERKVVLEEIAMVDDTPDGLRVTQRTALGRQWLRLPDPWYT